MRRPTLVLALVSLLAACAKKPDYGAVTGRGGAAGGVAGHGGAAGGAGREGTGGNAGIGGAAIGGVPGTGGNAGIGGAAGIGSAGAGGGGRVGTGSGVLQYHNHATRDGVYVDAALTRTAVAGLHVDPTFASPTLDGVVLAQLLYLDGVGGKPDLVFAVTKANHVYALNAATGTPVWDMVVAPVGIRPSTVCTAGPVGIIGTPIIDGGRRIIYMDAMTAAAAAGDGGSGGMTTKHMVYALDADTGAVRSGWPVDVDAKARDGALAFDSTTQNQRGALALLNGILYVPYGGFGGDCGAYHGWVIGISTDDPTHVISWATRAARAGIWAPAGVTTDGTSLFVATGNAVVGDNWLDGEAVLRLPPSLAHTDSTTDYYSPSNWSYLDATDLDLGGTAPLLVDVPGANPSKLVVALGKDQQAYVLDRTNLGGIGAPLIGAHVAGEIIAGASVTYATPIGTFVAFRGFGWNCFLVAQGHISVFTITPTTPPTLKMVWCGGPPSLTGPAVSMARADGTDAMIWMVGLLDSRLHANDAQTGEEIFAGGGAGDVATGVVKYQSAMVAHGRVFIPGDRVYAFTP